MKGKPNVFILDVDGVLSDGKLYYTEQGKVMKVFSADDHDALSLLAPHIELCFISGDHRGFPITRRRIVDDMKMRLEQVSTIKRIEWIAERWNPAKVIYMGDGIFDHYVFEKVGYAIAPADADAHARKSADYVTRRRGGDRAVAEACLHLLKKFFVPFNPRVLPGKQIKLSGTWTT